MAKHNPLVEFPPEFHYMTADPAEQDRFHAMLGRLLAAENVGTLEATQRIDEAIEAGRAQMCRTWLDSARERLRRMRAAQLFCEENPAADINAHLEKMSAWNERAAEKLRKAQEEAAEAGNEKAKAAQRVKMRAEAEELLAPGDLTIISAWHELQQLLKK